MKNHAALLVRDHDKILFVKRATVKKILPNIWAVPSGTMEEGETSEQTAIREAKEELECDIIIEKVLAVVELPEFDSRLHFILCKSSSDIHYFDTKEIQEIQWLTFEEFFNIYPDEQIGHGLQYLRKHPEILSNI